MGEQPWAEQPRGPSGARSRCSPEKRLPDKSLRVSAASALVGPKYLNLGAPSAASGCFISTSKGGSRSTRGSREAGARNPAPFSLSLPCWRLLFAIPAAPGCSQVSCSVLTSEKEEAGGEKEKQAAEKYGLGEMMLLWEWIVSHSSSGQRDLRPLRAALGESWSSLCWKGP